VTIRNLNVGASSVNVEVPHPLLPPAAVRLYLGPLSCYNPYQLLTD